MELEANTYVWVWDTGRWLEAVVIDPGQQFTRVRLENGLSGNVSTSNVACRNPDSCGTDKPRPLRYTFE